MEAKAAPDVITNVLMVETENVPHEKYESTDELRVAISLNLKLRFAIEKPFENKIKRLNHCTRD